MSCRLLALFATLHFAATATAQAPDAAKQSATVVTNLTKVGVASPTSPVETDALLVAGTLPDARLKVVAAAAQKAFDFTRGALKLDPKDKPWTGKLAVVVLSDRRDFVGYVRSVEMRRAEMGETTSMRLRGDFPTVVSGVGAGDKPTDARLAADASALVAAALLTAKSGATSGAFTLPDWLLSGFGKAAVQRATGGSSAAAAHRGRVKIAALKSRVKAADVWAGGVPDRDLYATSIADYLAFGPGAGKFEEFLGGFKPGENNREPTTESAVAAAGWEGDAFDAAWKKWLATGK